MNRLRGRPMGRAGHVVDPCEFGLDDLRSKLEYRTDGLFSSLVMMKENHDTEPKVLAKRAWDLAIAWTKEGQERRVIPTQEQIENALKGMVPDFETR